MLENREMFAKYMILNDELNDSHPGKPWLKWKKISRFDEVIRSFSKLNGDRCNILIVSENPPPGSDRDEPFFAKALSISGGKDDQYLCEAYIENEYTNITLCNPDASNPLEDVWLTRGQPETFPKYQIVSAEMARQALEAFVKRGELSDELNWETRM